MDLQQIIAQAGGLQAIAGQLGIGEDQAQSGMAALLPAVLGGFKKSAQGNGEGLGGLMSMVEGLGGGGLLDNVVGSQPTDLAAGNNVLGSIFGSKDVSRAVADQAAQNSGLDSGLLRKMLPMVAMLVAGFMAKQGGGASSGGGLGGMIGNALGGGGVGGLLGGVLGGGQQQGDSAGGLGGLGAMLDMDGDGNPLDDIMGMAGKLTGH